MNVNLINYSTQKGLILEKIEEKDSIVKKTLLDLGGIIDGTFTFGTGITAMLPAVKQLMSGSTPQLTEQEQYQKERDALLERAKENLEEKIMPAPSPVEVTPAPIEENLEEKIMPAPSPVEVTPAPGFENLVNQQRKEQAVEEKRLTTSSPTIPAALPLLEKKQVASSQKVI